MKKWLLLASSLVMMNAHAESWCGYKDYFRISDRSHPAIYVVSGYSDYDVYLQIVGPRSFVIGDMPQCRGGYSHVTVAYDNDHWCTLDIKDGPFINHPDVKASCNGMNYLGTHYDGMTSYSYSIDLD